MTDSVQRFLKDGETIEECIARNRRDVDVVLGLLAKEKSKTEQLARDLADARAFIATLQGYLHGHGE